MKADALRPRRPCTSPAASPSEGAPIFAVAVVEEGLELRRAGISQPILVMGWIGKDQLSALVAGGLTPNIHSLEQAEELRDFLEE